MLLGFACTIFNMTNMDQDPPPTQSIYAFGQSPQIHCDAVDPCAINLHFWDPPPRVAHLVPPYIGLPPPRRRVPCTRILFQQPPPCSLVPALFTNEPWRGLTCGSALFHTNYVQRFVDISSLGYYSIQFGILYCFPLFRVQSFWAATFWHQSILMGTYHMLPSHPIQNRAKVLGPLLWIFFP